MRPTARTSTVLAFILVGSAAFLPRYNRSSHRPPSSSHRHSAQQISDFRNVQPLSTKELGGCNRAPTSCAFGASDAEDVEVDAPPLTTAPSLPSARHLRRNIRPNPHDIPNDPVDRWEFFYDLLRQFYTEHGHAAIPVGPAVNQSLLRNWCADQRKSYMKTLGVLDLGEKANWGTEYLSRKRKERLDAAGFNWGHLETNDDEVFSDEFQSKVRTKYGNWTWHASYEELCRYKKEHGDTKVPLRTRGDLYIWAAQQRRLGGEMPAHRRDMLGELGFDWDGEQGPDALRVLIFDGDKDNFLLSSARRKKAVMWPERIRQLKAFREEHGHCDVPEDYGGPDGLGSWTARQRINSKLSPKSRTQLERMGFKFII